MAARVCPHCRQLNGLTEKRCFRCGRRLPGKVHDAMRRLTGDLFGTEAPVTLIVVALELLVFALCVAAERSLPLWFTDGFRVSTLVRFGALGAPLGVPLGEVEPYRLAAAVFVHGNLLHVAMNMLMFVNLGQRLENELGAARATLLFVLSGVLGFVASEVWYGGAALTVGASGGVFGQIGAQVGMLYARRDPDWRRELVRYLIYAALLAFAFAFRVNTAAHLGGFAAGIGLGFLLHEERRRLGWGGLMTLLAVVSVVGSVASVGLSTRSPAWQTIRAIEMLHE